MTDSSTRISRSEVVDLCEAIHASGPLPVFGARVLGLFLCVRLTLTYLRHNLPQELLAEVYCVSQATVSRVRRLHAPDRRLPERQCSNGGGSGSHGPADHRRHPPGVLVLERPSRA
ncbi:transposase family protein [Actinomyces oris]|uniref:transposase family protein n=1 Tax=Actinomyces oris TaxID=544580 RepID=UPI0009D761B6|nr:transposase family protein [Actinomyces oris]